MTDVATGLEYDMVTTNMTHKYFNAIKTKLHVLGVATIDREITQIKTGKKITMGKNKGKDEVKGTIKSESRIITFRDDNFNIDSKSRFAEIVDEIEFSPAEFITAIEDAIKAEHNKQLNKKSIEETKVEQADEKEQFIEESVNKKHAKLAQNELESIKEELTTYLKVNKMNMDKIKPLLAKAKELGFTTPIKVDNLEQARELLSFTK
jgi:hypothetical protein